ncbi:MAG: NYN domain-containing protein [Chloroflexi bacterium]|nr:NYN domain-containing protein [Chloroflexota bacterium]
MAEANRLFGGQDVAMFIDFENIYISVLAEYEVNPDFEALIEKAQSFGRVAVAQAYADWTPYSHYINAIHAYEIDPIYVPAYHYGEGGKQRGGAIKNSVDMFLCINAMKMLYSHPNIQTFVLVTGDRDFVPLVKTIREFGKRAVVIGVAGAASAHLAQAADEFFFYHQITDNLKPPEKEKVKARDPYDTLIEAVKLARQRGYVATLASLKLLMTELIGDFDESKYKDSRGKPIQRFKDFVKEAERKGKVKLFSTGTINEVFLPNEDPRKTSRIVEEVMAPAEPAPEEETSESQAEDEIKLEITTDQWRMFINTISQIEGASPFVRVFDSLRGLRNQGLLDLSNKELKTMIIQAIHLGLLNRSSRGRGRRTLYQLTNDPTVLGRYVEVSSLPAFQPRAMPEAATSAEPESASAAAQAAMPLDMTPDDERAEANSGFAAPGQGGYEPRPYETPASSLESRYLDEAESPSESRRADDESAHDSPDREEQQGDTSEAWGSAEPDGVR